jgi:hypothetical protein
MVKKQSGLKIRFKNGTSLRSGLKSAMVKSNGLKSLRESMTIMMRGKIV